MNAGRAPGAVPRRPAPVSGIEAGISIQGGCQMKRLAALAVLALPLLVGTGQSAAQGGPQTEQLLREMKRDIDGLKRDLQEIKTLLRSRGAAEAPPDDNPKNLVLDLEGVQTKGDRNARLVLVDFTDYQ
jgi:hypothetical protein